MGSPHSSHTYKTNAHNIDRICSKWLDGSRAQIRALLLVIKIRRSRCRRKSRRRTKSKASRTKLEEFASTKEI
jgi:hypothetical protein